MWKKLFTSLHVLLTLSAVGCCVYLLMRQQSDNKDKTETEARNEGHSANADFALRRFLGVKWLGGDYEVPDDVEHYGVALLHYKDGEFVERMNSSIYSREKGTSRVMPKVILWGPTPDGPKVISLTGFTSFSQGGKDHPLHRMQGLSRCFGPVDDGLLRGCRVIGNASSGEWLISKSNDSRDLEKDANHYKEILYHVVKFFPSQDEAMTWMSNQSEDRKK